MPGRPPAHGRAGAERASVLVRASSQPSAALRRQRRAGGPHGCPAAGSPVPCRQLDRRTDDWVRRRRGWGRARLGARGAKHRTGGRVRVRVRVRYALRGPWAWLCARREPSRPSASAPRAELPGRRPAPSAPARLRSVQRRLARGRFPGPRRPPRARLRARRPPHARLGARSRPFLWVRGRAGAARPTRRMPSRAGARQAGQALCAEWPSQHRRRGRPQTAQRRRAGAGRRRWVPEPRRRRRPQAVRTRVRQRRVHRRARRRRGGRPRVAWAAQAPAARRPLAQYGGPGSAPDGPAAPSARHLRGMERGSREAGA